MLQINELTRQLSEKDTVIHSLAYDLIEASDCIDGGINNPIRAVIKFREIADKALDSITDKGEK